MFWHHFYWYSDACIRNKWPIISHERYFERFSHVEETVFGQSMQEVALTYSMDKVPSTEDMLALKAYPVTKIKEDALIAKYTSQFDCWADLLKNENHEFEQMVGELLDRITEDFGEKPEGVLIYEDLPKALISASHKRGIPVMIQNGGVLRRPFASIMNAFTLINDDSAEAIKSKYDRFVYDNAVIPMLSRKGLLRLFVSAQYMMDIHNNDAEPEYDVGVLYNSASTASYHIMHGFASDHEMNARTRKIYDRVLIRARPGFEPTKDALDNSPSCFHFCCKCKRVVGCATKGMFEAMLAGSIAHEYGSSFFHSFCNNGIEDDSKGVAPIEFLNFVLFGLCTPFTWLTSPDYLRFLLSGPSEKELYMRSLEHFTRHISRDDLEFYYMSDNREYRLGDLLYFTSGHKPHEYAAYYCIGGLSGCGETCTWSSGGYTSFEFDLSEPANESLTISILLTEVAMDWDITNPTQTVTCEVNGVNCGSVTLVPEKKYLRFTVPPECFTDKLQVTFQYSYLHSVEDSKLAVAFELMCISRHGQRLIAGAMSDEIARLETHIESIYSTRSWKLGNGIMKAAAKIIQKRYRKDNTETKALQNSAQNDIIVKLL